ncbi:MAG: 16S rRNA (uracil(1498)-N(3))-methyltransferase [Litorimonas sp.]
MRENYTLPRLHVPDDLAGETTVDLPREQAHYLTTVIRKNVGDSVRVFNGEAGEWRAEIVSVSKKSTQLVVQEQLRPPLASLDVTLLFAPVRKHRTSFIIEKGTELGVATFQPVLTARTQFPRLNVDKARSQAIEAAEQTERLDIPEVKTARPLLDVLGEWTETPLLFADEAGDAQSASDVCANIKAPIGFIIGPEGGFTDAERAELRGMKNVHPVALGPRILRADTAAVALLSVWQSVNGDW